MCFSLADGPDEARGVLSTFASKIVCRPFGSGAARGYDFEGIGDYGALSGADMPTGWCPRRDSNPCCQIENLES